MMSDVEINLFTFWYHLSSVSFVNSGWSGWVHFDLLFFWVLLPTIELGKDVLGWYSAEVQD